MAKKGLGRGLDALLYDNDTNTYAKKEGVTMLRLSDVEPNRDQARKQFDPAALSELADSIMLHGLVQPIVVRKKSNGFYEIIAGERRWRASKLAGLSEIPVIIKDLDDREASEISLIENLQRENLNPVEEANGYRNLIEQYDLTQEEAARRVGKSRAAVANILRLLRLPDSVLSLVEEGILSNGHARALIPLVGVLSNEELLKHAKHIAESAISVRETEALVKKLLAPAPPKPDPVQASYYTGLESRISRTLGRRTTIKQSPDGKGSLQLTYSTPEDLENLIKALCGGDFFTDETI